MGPELLHLVRWLHIVGATLLFGTGLGIAFFMVMAHQTKDARIVAHTAGVVVVADWIFTASAVLVQPITGALLARAIGWSFSEGWLALSLGLYVLAGVFWVPVLFMQVRMRDLARQAAGTGAPLPPAYHRLYWTWFLFGFPAFFAALAIIWLMQARPEISW